MKIVFFLLTGILILSLLLLIPLLCKMRLVLDLNSRSFYYSLKAVGINLSKGKVYLLEDFTISNISVTSKLMQVKSPKLEQSLMIQKLLSMLKIKDVTLLVDGGLAQDAFVTSMAIGTIKSIIASLIPSFNKSKRDFEIRISPDYDENNFNVASELNVSVNLLSIIISVVYAKTNYRKQIKVDKYV